MLRVVFLVEGGGKSDFGLFPGMSALCDAGVREENHENTKVRKHEKEQSRRAGVRQPNGTYFGGGLTGISFAIVFSGVVLFINCVDFARRG